LLQVHPSRRPYSQCCTPADDTSQLRPGGRRFRAAALREQELRHRLRAAVAPFGRGGEASARRERAAGLSNLIGSDPAFLLRRGSFPRMPRRMP